MSPQILAPLTPSLNSPLSRSCSHRVPSIQGMVDVVSRRCDSPGCKRQPSGTTDATQVQFCSLHRGDGRAGYTLLMLAQRERIAAQAALEETQKQQRARAPISGSSWPGGEEMAFPDYRSRWEGTSPGSSASFSTNGAPTPGSSGSFPQPSPSGSFLSNQQRSNDGSTLGDGNYGPDSQTVKHNPNQWLWTAPPRGSSAGARRPPPLKNPSEAGVLGIGGRPPAAPDSLGDSPGADWTKPTSAPTQGIYPAKRHCSPRRRSFSHSPEPGSRSMVGMPASMASSPASPNMGAIMGMSSATSGTPSPSGAMGIPTPPGSSGSAALPPPHGAPRRSAQRLPQPQFPTRALPRSSSGGPPRPPRSLSPGGLTARSNSEGLYAVSSSGRSPVGNVGFSPSGPQSASSVGGFSGVFSPGNLSVASGGGPGSASPRWASPRRRAFGHSRTRSQGSVADTLEDLSIVDPVPPTLEPLRVFPAPGPLRSPRDRWRGGLPERRSSEIILPLPDRTQPEPGHGPVSDSRRRSFTASLFDQPGGRQIAPDGKVDAMDTVEGGEGASAGITSGGSAGSIVGNGGEGADIGGGRWEPGLWTSTSGEGGDFQMMSAGYRQQAWPQQMQAGSGGDHGDAHVEEKETRRNSHISVGTMPLTSTESLGDREGSVFFSAES